MRRSAHAMVWRLIASSTLLTGCAAWTTPTPSSHPYFEVDQLESKIFQSLAKKQEGIAEKCAETKSCDQVYFTCGLLGLYESREVAAKYFEKVLAVVPESQLVASSKAWLELLKDSASLGTKSRSETLVTAPSLAKTNSSLTMVADRLVRDLLEREVALQQLRQSKDSEAETVEVLQRELLERDHKIEALQSKKEFAKNTADPLTIQSLQKQIVERDKRIDELSAQLEALKRIDQEMREKVRPIRPPVTPAPAPGLDATP